MELLVRVADKVNDDFYLNCKCSKRGDVIAAQPDGWRWGRDELTLPFWRIFVAPDMPEGDALALTSPELETDPKNPSRTLQRYAFKLNLDDPSLPADVAAFIADDARKQSSIVIKRGLDPAKPDPSKDYTVVTGYDVLTLKTTKPAVQDPAIFGPSPNTF